VSPTGTSAAQAPPAARGRIDKRLAILDAASTVFARQGYAQAGVDEIAALAGVAKATVYTHFQDKENLLRQAVTADADRALAANLAVVDRITVEDGDLRPMLDDVARRLLQCYCDERSQALRRLLAAEINHFPELLDIVASAASPSPAACTPPTRSWPPSNSSPCSPAPSTPAHASAPAPSPTGNCEPSPTPPSAPFSKPSPAPTRPDLAEPARDRLP
jgi:AcrR family transcriptional regulator